MTPITWDQHSYARPNDARVKHVDLDLEVLFDRKILRGTATLDFVRIADAPLLLDTRDLSIESVTADNGAAGFQLGTPDPILGTMLKIDPPAGAKRVTIRYQTSPKASALQWLDAAQTAGGRDPYLFSQSQAIHARSWIPLQDSPGVRITWSARIRTPKNLRTVMSAEFDPNTPRSGDYAFKMDLPIPSYLLAIAAGDLDFRPLGSRAGVWSEPSVVGRAAKEFEDTEKMIQAAERLYGPYRWGRYDILVLPPSFPFGGMENPRLTFATPTVLAGDKSLVSLVSHELAHSWAGNLVTNATWSDFWLNEGFTVYLERRILEEVYGKERATMEAVLGRQELDKELAKLPPRDQVLHIDLTGRDPDDGATSVPYEKGDLFLVAVEREIGRGRMDDFLKGYFNHFAFQSITTDQFLDYLNKQLPGLRVPVQEWVFQPGLPKSAPSFTSEAFTRVEAAAAGWIQGTTPLSAIPKAQWSTQEWLHFLFALPADLGSQRMAELDRAFGFTRTGNDEILDQWLLMAIKNKYRPADARLDEFLITVGRRKYLKPLYEELVKTPEGKARAQKIFERARPKYHPITTQAIEQIVK